MNISTLTFNHPEESTNSSTHSFELMDWLEISLYSINLLFSFPIHCYIIRLIVTGSGITSEFLNLNLSICEIGICINSLVFILSFWFPEFEVLDLFFQGLTFTGRPQLQCLMCVERYLAVVHPVTFLKYKPLRYRLIFCAPVWIFSLSSCILFVHLLLARHFRALACFSAVELLLVLFIQLFCLVAVLRALKKSGPGDRKKEEENHMKRRAFHLILITTVNMIILYFPIAFTSVSVIFINQNKPVVWFTSTTCFILAGFVQPFLFLHRAGKLSYLCKVYPCQHFYTTS